MTFKNPQALVDTQWLADHLDAPDVRVIDATYFLPVEGKTARDSYMKARIPGAQFFDVDDIAVERSPLPHMVPTAEKFSSRVRKLGLGDGVRMVVYDSRNGCCAAARVWWTFRYFGYEDIAVLNGGLGKWITRIPGIDHMDMMNLFKDMNIKISDNKLNTAAKELLSDKQMGKIQDVTWKDWLPNFKGFMKYGIRDVEILKELDNKLKIFKTYITLQQMTNITNLESYSAKTVMVEHYLFTTYWNKFVFPNIKRKDRQSFMGAWVANPIPGIHKNVGIVDFASLYPTTDMAFNLSPDTFLFSQLKLENMGLDIEYEINKLKQNNISYVDTGYSEELFGKRYVFLAHTEKVGIIPESLRNMYLERKRVKKEMYKFEEDTDDYIALDKRQYVIKIILNSAYGAMGSNIFRFYTPEVADSITYFARKSIHNASGYFNSKYSIPTIYGDTDSLFLYLDQTNENFLQSACNKFIGSLKENVVKKHNFGFNEKFYLMDLEHEKTLTHLFLGDGKKRYYGIEASGKKYIKGLNIIRKDCPMLLRQLLNELAEKSVLERLTLKDVESVVDNVIDTDYENIGIYKSFTKQFDDYVKTKPQHLKGALFANEKLGLNISHMDNPLLFYIKSKCQDELKEKDRDKAICLNKEDLHLIDSRKDIFELDYNTFIDKQVIKQVSEFCLIPSVEWIINQYKEKNIEFYPPKAPKEKCPICDKRHSKGSLVIKCMQKLNKELQKKKDNNEDISEEVIIINNALEYYDKFHDLLKNK